MSSANPCAVSDVLAKDYTNAVRTVNRKFNALQRLAELLDQLGDAQGALPDISSLIPIQLIDTSAYTNLVQACPFLNLPPNPTDAALAGLKNQLTTAYSNLIRRLNQHPFIRMSKLQAQLDKVSNALAGPLNQGEEFVQCLQQACSSAEGVAGFLENSQAEIEKFKRGYLAVNGQVLTQEMQGRVSVVRGMIDNLNELLSPAPLATPPETQSFPQIPIPTDHPIPLPPEGTVI